MRRLTSALTLLLAFVLGTGPAFAYSLQNPAPGFGPPQYQNLIPDLQFTGVDMSADDIAAFLGKQGVWGNRDGGVSWLTNYQIPEYQTVPYKYRDTNGNCQWSSVSVRQYYDTGSEALYGMSVPTLIAQKSAEFHVAAEVILATLEKESSAVTRTSPQSDAVEMWVLGFGWNDTMAGCGYDQATAQSRANAYGGVGQQITYAMSSQFGFRKWYDQYATTYGNTFTSSDGASITAVDRSTRALYTYTPYVYNGNYNFWLLTNTWFAPPVYQPTNLAKETNGTIYVIDENKKWPITAAGFTAWNFSMSNVHDITPTERALPTADYWTQLALGPDGTVYYIENAKKRPLTSERLMQRYGFSWGDVAPKTQSILDRVPYGLPMHELLLPTTGDGTVYLATSGILYPVSGTIYNDSWRFSWSDTARVPGYVVYNLPKGPIMSNLVITDNGDGTVFFIDGGNAYPVSGAVAQAWGFDLSTVRTVGPALLGEKPDPGPLTTLARQIDGDGTVYLIQGKKKYPMSGTYFRAHHYSLGDVRTISPAMMNTLGNGGALR